MLEDRIAEFVCRNAGVSSVRHDERFFESGLVTSMFALQIVMFVEKEYGIALDDDDLNLNYFASVNAIVELIRSKTEQAQVADHV